MENLNLIDIEELILSGNIVSAEKQIDDFLINHPNNPDLYYYKGLCILTTNKFTNSLEYFDKAIELDPKNNIKYKNSISNVYLKGGNTYYDLNDFDTANELYDKGNEIHYWTARGSITGINHKKLTKDQLKKWGCKYNSLRVGDKPNYDFWIDDKARWSEDFFKNQL